MTFSEKQRDSIDEIDGYESQNDVALETNGLVVSYGRGPHILKRASVSFHEHEITCIIGPNGAGKSTLLKAIFGISVRINEGGITFYDEDITHYNSGKILRKGISFVPQGQANFPAMTVRENLEMGAFVKKNGDLKQDIDQLLDRFPILREKQHKMVGNLSGGQQQIMEMARALLLSPKLMLLDEPSLGLAPKIRATVFEEIKRIYKEGTTIALVEQNASAALKIADHAIVLELGRKRFEGTGEEIKSNEKIRKLYLGG